MPERIRPSKRPQPGKKRSNRSSGDGQAGRYFPMIVFGGVLVVIAVIIGVLVFSPSANAKTDPQDKSQGPADAKVVITEYGDFQCPACKAFALEIHPKIKADFVDTGKIRFAFRQMAFIGPESTLAAEASECANDQGKFWEFYEKLYQNQGGENTGVFTNDSLAGYAKDLGLDVNKFSQCLSSNRYKAKVEKETNDGQAAGVYSTPSLLLNGKLIDWGGDYNKLTTIINDAVNSAK